MKFIRIISLVLVFISVCFLVEGQTKEAIIKNIREEFLRINTDKKLKKTKLEAEEFLENIPDGGGELTGFKRNDSIVKITEWIGISYGNRTREFYFRNQKLIFVYEKFDAFVSDSKTGELDKSKTKAAFEGRYYFNNENLIEEKLSGKKPMDDDEKNIASELLSSAKGNLKILTEKK